MVNLGLLGLFTWAARIQCLLLSLGGLFSWAARMQCQCLLVCPKGLCLQYCPYICQPDLCQGQRSCAPRIALAASVGPFPVHAPQRVALSHYIASQQGQRS